MRRTQTTLPNECVMGCCLAHRKQVYWSPQFACWVHPDAWPCAELAALGAQ